MTNLPDDQYVWPDRLQIRDTKLHDDLGDGGQRIYTTAGRGHETREYLRADVVREGGSLICNARQICFHEGCQYEDAREENRRLRARISELETAIASVKRNVENSLKVLR